MKIKKEVYNPSFNSADPYGPFSPIGPAKKITSDKGFMQRMAEKVMEKKRQKEEPYIRALSLMPGTEMKKGGKVSASKRADGICKKGKTKGRMI